MTMEKTSKEPRVTPICPWCKEADGYSPIVRDHPNFMWIVGFECRSCKKRIMTEGTCR